MKVFGEPGSSDVIDRPTAYALVRTPRGVPLAAPPGRGLFLPGGRIEPGELPMDAAVRELAEECRVLARPVAVQAEAVQFFTASTGDHYRPHMHFVTCEFEGHADGEGDHPTRYVSAAPPQPAFVHVAHWWALTHFLADLAACYS